MDFTTFDVTFYDTTTGQITLVATANEMTLPKYEADHPSDEYVFGKFHPDEYFYGLGGMQLRPLLSVAATWDVTSIAADGAEIATLSDLPDPSVVTVAFDPNLGVQPEEPIDVTDGTFVFAAEAPGIYTVTASSFPYVDFKQEITAT